MHKFEKRLVDKTRLFVRIPRDASRQLKLLCALDLAFGSDHLRRCPWLDGGRSEIGKL